MLYNSQYTQVAFRGSFSGTWKLKTSTLDYSVEVCKEVLMIRLVNRGQRIGPDWRPQRQTA